MKSLKFRCRDCDRILNFNEEGFGQGSHNKACSSNVTTKCKCGQEYTGQFSKVYAEVRQHLECQCSHIISDNSRRLMNF